MTGAGTTSSGPAIVLLFGVALAFLTVLSAAYALATEDTVGKPTRVDVDDEPAESPNGGLLAGLGRVAGEVADRLERTDDAENEVYRAWHGMTRHLEVGNPETSTPMEFAAAARDAGIDDAHVHTLTGLFQEVRYGDVSVTEEHEEQAVESLRAIEDAFTER